MRIPLNTLVIRSGPFRLVVPTDCRLPLPDSPPGPMHACPGTLEHVELDALGNESWRTYDGEYDAEMVQYLLVAALLDGRDNPYRFRGPENDLEDFLLAHAKKHEPPPPAKLPPPDPLAKTVDDALAPRGDDICGTCGRERRHHGTRHDTCVSFTEPAVPVTVEDEPSDGFAAAAANEGARIAAESRADDEADDGGPAF